MNILITGATGFIGSHIVDALTRAGHRCLLCVRRPEAAQRRFPKTECLQLDFCESHKASEWVSRLTGVDLVINCVGIIREQHRQTFDTLHRDTPIALFTACEQAGVRRVIQISALGADSTAFSHYHLSKKAADDVLCQLDLEWAILMPSIVYGPNAKSMALFRALASLPAIPLIERGDQPVQPIHIGDLVRMVMHCVESEQPPNRRIILVGPEPITLKALLTRLRTWLGYPAPHFISLPYALALNLGRWSGFLGATPIGPETIRMLQKGNTGEVKDFMRTFGYAPKSLGQVLAQTPSQQADHWHAGLFLLRPWLRWSLAFVWLFSGLVSAWLIPQSVGLGLLAQTGIPDAWAPLLLYGACALDLLIGIAILRRYRPRLVGYLQIGVILFYTLIITLTQPEQWLHPFGPISKNIPMLMVVLVMMTLEQDDE